MGAKTLPRTLAVGDVVELRGYRGAIGTSQIVNTLEFANFADWAAWHRNLFVQVSDDVITAVLPMPPAAHPLREQ